MRYNSSKIIKEATEVISAIELQVIKQSGYKLGDKNIKIDLTTGYHVSVTVAIKLVIVSFTSSPLGVL